MRTARRLVRRGGRVVTSAAGVGAEDTVYSALWADAVSGALKTCFAEWRLVAAGWALFAYLGHQVKPGGTT